MTRILIVEDDADISFALDLDLRGDGYETVVASDGAQALQLARDGNFQVILLDVMLPGKDGFSVCRELRRAGVNAPVILLTAKTQEQDKITGLDAGADDYLTKPFSPNELRARIRAVLRRSAGHPEIVKVGEVEIDFSRGELRRRGEPVPATATELKMLRAFVGAAGRVLSRDQLLDAAWGAGVFVTDRVVDNHIVSLRRKIEPDPAHPRYLVNVRGLGYRLDG